MAFIVLRCFQYTWYTLELFKIICYVGHIYKIYTWIFAFPFHSKWSIHYISPLLLPFTIVWELYNSVCFPLSYYRHTSFYWASHYFALQILFFFLINWWLVATLCKSVGTTFPTVSLHVSVSHFDNSHNISNPPPANKLMTCWRHRLLLAFLAIKDI